VSAVVVVGSESAATRTKQRVSGCFVEHVEIQGGVQQAHRAAWWGRERSEFGVSAGLDDD